LICPDERAFLSRVRGARAIANRERLTREPEYYSRLGMPLDELVHDSESSPTREAALNLNTACAPPDFPHRPIRSDFSFHNPVISRRILDPLESDDPRVAAEGVEVARWFLRNVDVPRGKSDDPGVGRQIKSAIDSAKGKHALT